jgi:hypothetical protein
MTKWILLRHLLGLLLLALVGLMFAQLIQDALGPLPEPMVPVVTSGGDSP